MRPVIFVAAAVMLAEATNQFGDDGLTHFDDHDDFATDDFGSGQDSPSDEDDLVGELKSSSTVTFSAVTSSASTAQTATFTTTTGDAGTTSTENRFKDIINILSNVRLSQGQPLTNFADFSSLNTKLEVSILADEANVEACGTIMTLPAVNTTLIAPYTTRYTTDDTRGEYRMTFACETGKRYTALMYDFSFMFYHGGFVNLECIDGIADTTDRTASKPLGRFNGFLSPATPLPSEGSYVFMVFQAITTQQQIKEVTDLIVNSAPSFTSITAVLGLGAKPIPIGAAYMPTSIGLFSAHYLETLSAADPDNTQLSTMYTAACENNGLSGSGIPTDKPTTDGVQQMTFTSALEHVSTTVTGLASTSAPEHTSFTATGYATSTAPNFDCGKGLPVIISQWLCDGVFDCCGRDDYNECLELGLLLDEDPILCNYTMTTTASTASTATTKVEVSLTTNTATTATATTVTTTIKKTATKSAAKRTTTTKTTATKSSTTRTTRTRTTSSVTTTSNTYQPTACNGKPEDPDCARHFYLMPARCTDPTLGSTVRLHCPVMCGACGPSSTTTSESSTSTSTTTISTSTLTTATSITTTTATVSTTTETTTTNADCYDPTAGCPSPTCTSVEIRFGRFSVDVCVPSLDRPCWSYSEGECPSERCLTGDFGGPTCDETTTTTTVTTTSTASTTTTVSTTSTISTTITTTSTFTTTSFTTTTFTSTTITTTTVTTSSVSTTTLTDTTTTHYHAAFDINCLVASADGSGVCERCTNEFYLLLGQCVAAQVCLDNNRFPGGAGSNGRRCLRRYDSCSQAEGCMSPSTAGHGCLTSILVDEPSESLNTTVRVLRCAECRPGKFLIAPGRCTARRRCKGGLMLDTVEPFEAGLIGRIESCNCLMTSDLSSMCRECWHTWEIEGGEWVLPDPGEGVVCMACKADSYLFPGGLCLPRVEATEKAAKSGFVLFDHREGGIAEPPFTCDGGRKSTTDERCKCPDKAPVCTWTTSGKGGITEIVIP